MKVNKKNKSAAVASGTVTGPFVAIGNRGVTILDVDELPNGINIGENALPPKTRYAAGALGHAPEPLWLTSHSWVQSSRTKDGSEPRFKVYPLDTAVKKGLVKRVDGVKVIRKADKKEFTGSVIADASWTPGQKQPSLMGFLSDTKGWITRRVEAKYVNENNGTESRNKMIVGQVIFPSESKAVEKAAKKSAEKGVSEEKVEKAAPKKPSKRAALAKELADIAK